MAISINWPTGIITIPKADLTLIQSTPTEVREMNLNWFRLQLKDLEDNDDGMSFLKTHIHNTEVSLGGLTYARVIEILDPYSITFENGQYAVNLVGANSNVGDKINVNQVSVRSANSAGLISNPAIEYASFNGGVAIDVINGTFGTIYNIGTPENPVNNFSDAFLIADYRGFNKLFIMGDITLISGLNVDSYCIIGEGPHVSTITLMDGCSTINTEFRDCHIVGVAGGYLDIRNCSVTNLSNFSGYISDTILDGTIVFKGAGNYTFSNVLDGDPSGGTSILDLDNAGNTNLGIRNFAGGVEIRNVTGGDIRVSMHTGRVILASSCTGGIITLRGIGSLEDNSNGSTIVKEALLNQPFIADAILDESINQHITEGTAGEVLGVLAQIGTGRWKINTITNTLTFYNANGDPLKIFDLKDQLGQPSSTDVFERIPQ